MQYPREKRREKKSAHLRVRIFFKTPAEIPERARRGDANRIMAVHRIHSES